MNHDFHDQRSLFLHTIIADRLPHAEILNLAFENVEKHIQDKRSLGYTLRWRALLLGPQEELIRLMKDPSEDGKAMRQSSPFAGVFSPSEREELFSAFRKKWDIGEYSNEKA